MVKHCLSQQGLSVSAVKLPAHDGWYYYYYYPVL
jgi:hypothetical protein